THGCDGAAWNGCACRQKSNVADGYIRATIRGKAYLIEAVAFAEHLEACSVRPEVMERAGRIDPAANAPLPACACRRRDDTHDGIGRRKRGDVHARGRAHRVIRDDELEKSA